MSSESSREWALTPAISRTGRGETMPMLATIGKLKNAIGVVAVQAPAELMDRAWKPCGVR